MKGLKAVWLNISNPIFRQGAILYSRCCTAHSLSLPAGLHPAHASQGLGAPQEAEAGAQGERASQFHPLLPCLECLQETPCISALT